MTNSTIEISNHTVYLAGSEEPDILIIQPVDEHDLEGIDTITERIASTAKKTAARVAYAAFKVDSWNDDLSPWEAPAVYGDDGFGDGAASTLSFIREALIPELLSKLGAENRPKIILGGYSLSAFFSLWAAYECETFDAVSSASSSVWFPGWIEYARANQPKCSLVYLSLGTKEEKVRNPVMREVGNNIRETKALIDEPCELEWNPGTHFTDPAGRTAKGFCWCLEQLIGTN